MAAEAYAKRPDAEDRRQIVHLYQHPVLQLRSRHREKVRAIVANEYSDLEGPHFVSRRENQNIVFERF
jgi:hypothetical protein